MVRSGGREDVSRLLDHDHGAGVCTRMASKLLGILLGIIVGLEGDVVDGTGLRFERGRRGWGMWQGSRGR